MTDAELIAQLRRGWTTLDYVAADRIEALAALHQAAVQDALAAEAYADELKAKLAKYNLLYNLLRQSYDGDLFQMYVDANEARIDAEAKLAKAEALLTAYNAWASGEPSQPPVTGNRKTTLVEMEGQTDE